MMVLDWFERGEYVTWYLFSLSMVVVVCKTPIHNTQPSTQMNHNESTKSNFVGKKSPECCWNSLSSKVTNVGCFGRFFLLYSAGIVEMFLLPRMVRDAISLLHPDKTTQPFIAFGGKLYGPRAFILGFPNKDVSTKIFGWLIFVCSKRHRKKSSKISKYSKRNEFYNLHTWKTSCC